MPWINIDQVPVVQHKLCLQGGAGSFKDRKPMGEVGCCGMLWRMDGRANPLMDRKVVGVVCFGVVTMVERSPHPQLLDAVWCSAVVSVV